jgi:hypothetical protein
MVLKRRGRPGKGPSEKLQNLAKVIAIKRAEEVQESSQWVKVIKRYKSRVRNRTTAIRAHCIECSGGSIKEVTECRITTCALHPFRLGKDPFREARAAARSAGGEVLDAEDAEDEDEPEDIEGEDVPE